MTELSLCTLQECMAEGDKIKNKAEESRARPRNQPVATPVTRNSRPKVAQIEPKAT